MAHKALLLMGRNNIFDFIPDRLDVESFDVLASDENVKIERIVSRGHASPESGWYDQEQNEWVIVLKGEAIIAFEDETEVNLKPGDYLNIPAHTKHKVSWTKPDEDTVWLAVHY